jgi:integral membrane sensor domain MASE1
MGDPIALVLFGGMLATMLGAIVGILIMLDDGD